MSHRPLVIKDISLHLPERTCFKHFSAQIHAGNRILIIGNNGTGKSTLLKIIQGIVEPTEGTISGLQDMVFGYVPQTVTDHPELSGGQRFNKALSAALSSQPDVLCLDEPTNHLDLKNKRSLIRMLKSFRNTLIIVSHDPEIMALDFDQIWHIEHEQIHIFKGDYEAYRNEHDLQERELIARREQLHKEKRILRKAEQQERERAASSRAANKYENDKNLLGAMKESGSRTAGKMGKKLADIDQKIKAGFADTFVHKKIKPNFNLNTRRLSASKSIVSIVDGSCGYDKPLLNNLSIQIKATEHIGIIGDNGTGKSTLLKALLHNRSVNIDGQWLIPPKEDVGYLDQHYSTLDPELTALQVIQQAAPQMIDQESRKLLNDFLFSKPHELSKRVSTLSGGEKARLSLAQIAAASYYLLLLDEVTNNVDLDTRAHIIEVLREYPGAMIIVTHDSIFLKELGITTVYEVANGMLKLTPF